MKFLPETRVLRDTEKHNKYPSIAIPTMYLPMSTYMNCMYIAGTRTVIMSRDKVFCFVDSDEKSRVSPPDNVIAS